MTLGLDSQHWRWAFIWRASQAPLTYHSLWTSSDPCQGLAWGLAGAEPSYHLRKPLFIALRADTRAFWVWPGDTTKCLGRRHQPHPQDCLQNRPGMDLNPCAHSLGLSSVKWTPGPSSQGCWEGWKHFTLKAKVPRNISSRCGKQPGCEQRMWTSLTPIST